MNTEIKKGKESKKFNVEELENRLEMAAIKGPVTSEMTDASTNNGCKANNSCTQDNW